MITRRAQWLTIAVGAAWLAGCGDGRAPTTPTPVSFLEGTWNGTVIIRPDGQPETSGSTTWSFDVVPQTNRQTFDATLQITHEWLSITTMAIAAVAPSATPPTQISTQGDYTSPRGCRGTLGSFGTAEATRIEASFHGVDCNGITFDGQVVLTKAPR